MGQPGYRVATVVSEMFQQNCLILHREGDDRALVFDPGLDYQAIFRTLAQEGLRLEAILNTHGHIDHIAGNRPLKAEFPGVPLMIGRNDADMLSDPEANLSAPFGLPVTSPPADRLLDEGETLSVAGFRFEIREIPGHSPGSIIYVSVGETPPFVIGGDVLFAGSIGRFDLPGGDGRLLIRGVKTKLLTLPGETVVYPGHGPSTTVDRERRSNPYVGDGALDELLG